MRLALLHRKNDPAKSIAVNPLWVKRAEGHLDEEGNAYTVIYYNGDGYPKYEEVDEDFETVLSKVNECFNMRGC